MGTIRYLDLAAVLEERVRRRPAEALPSIAAMAEEYRVSYQTVWKATRVLADKGVIKVRAGARTVPAAGARPEGPRERFLDILRSHITGGTWKSGEPVPKFAYFQTVHHVGQDTITRTMHRLAGEGLLHKRGRRWIVGPSPSAPAKLFGSSPRAGDSPPKVVLLLFPNLMDANNFFHPSPFISHFADELMKHGLKIEIVLHDKQELEAVDTVTGIDGIESYINELGGRYYGLLAQNPGSSLEYFQRCLAMAAGKKKPAILYDPQNRLSSLTRTVFGGRAPFFRLFFDEAAAAALAVDVLVNRGHRVIGFPNMFTPRDPWVAQRIECVRQAAARYGPPPRLICPKQAERFWTYVQDKPITVLNYLFRGITKTLRLRTELTQGIQAGSSIRRRLLSATPSMQTVLNEGATSIIAGNDYIARDYHYWFRIMGIPVPRRISMISFDNQPEFMAYPMSTIDPGFARLGYLAAHILIGDIPVKTDSEGRIAGVCTLVDRGSVGPARGGDKGRLG